MVNLDESMGPGGNQLAPLDLQSDTTDCTTLRGPVELDIASWCTIELHKWVCTS